MKVMNKKERNAAIRELDSVRAQIKRNEAKADKIISESARKLNAETDRHDALYSKVSRANVEANKPLLRRVAFLAAEVKELI